MENVVISKIIGEDSESGLQKCVEITQVVINLKNKFVEVYYDINLINKAGKIISVVESDKVYFRRNVPAQIGERQKEGGKPGETEEFEEITANPQFNIFISGQVGKVIIEMLKADLEKYPNL
jgi:exosome complex RNA-binding protein Rrp42 (RNase PH superfamily)